MSTKNKPTNWPGLYRYSSMGMELAASITALTLAGWWVDYKFDTNPNGVLVGAVLGIVGGSYNFIRQALQLMKTTGSADKGNNSGRHEDDNHVR